MSNEELLKKEILETYRKLGDLIGELLKVDEKADSNSLPIQEKEIEEAISEELSMLGILPNVLGYNYLKAAIVMTVKNPQCIHSMMKNVYKNVAEEYGTTTSRVERAMRHAVEKAFSKENSTKRLYEIFGNTISSEKGKATNSEFIATIADYIKRKIV